MSFHTDQGLCIAFTPALIVRGDAVVENADVGTFRVQLRGGDRVELDLHGVDLVFMLGDGVNQFVNSKVRGESLRAVPHELTMPEHQSHEWRLWYGRMFLAPRDAISMEHGANYGELQDMLTEAWVTEDERFQHQLSLGCSGDLQTRELRELTEDPPCASGARRRCSGSCANNQKQCWWRCMNFTEVEATCASKDMAFNCTNRRDEISIG